MAYHVPYPHVFYYITVLCDCNVDDYTLPFQDFPCHYISSLMYVSYVGTHVLHLSPFVLGLYPLGIYSFVFRQCLTLSIPSLLTNYFWKSKVPFSAKAFAWLVVYEKVNTEGML